jgi:cytidylate kinase
MTRILRFEKEDKEVFISEKTAEQIEKAFQERKVDKVEIGGNKYGFDDIKISPTIHSSLVEKKVSKQKEFDNIRKNLREKGVL